MSAASGNNFLLKVEDTPGAGTYTTVGGLRTATFKRVASAIDATNHGSNQYKELLDTAGIRSITMSGSGIFTNSATLTRIEDACISQTLTNFQLVDASAGGRTYTGSFKIASFDRSGDYSKEQTFSIALDSSGAIVVS